MSVYSTLREANNVRQAEWDVGGNIDLSYAANELAGEVSEAISEAVILLEEGLCDSRTDLANELADVVICCDLIGIRAGLDPTPTLVSTTSKTFADMQRWVNELGSDLQLVCNTVKKLERERHGMPGSRSSLEQLADGLWNVLFDTYAIAACTNINLDVVVAQKFNATSAKVGLHTRMEV